jgi:preprotein translocase subunit SecY
MIDAFVNIFRVRELRRSVLITMGILAVYRLGMYIPVPGLDTRVVKEFVDRMMEQPLGQVLGLVNLLSGANWLQMTAFSLGIMPYISATIIFQLLLTVSPTLEKLNKEGESGRRRIRQYERLATVAICALQASMMVSLFLRNTEHPKTMSFFLEATLTMTAGGVFLMWLGDQITAFGVGNGISFIIMAGILDRLPAAVQDVVGKMRENTVNPVTMGLLGFVFVVIVFGIIMVTQGQRRIVMQQAKHVRGRRVYGGQRQYLPISVIAPGVIPIVFASSLLAMVRVLLDGIGRLLSQRWPTMSGLGSFLAFRGDFPGLFAYALLIYLFCFFWTKVQFRPDEIANNLKEYGSFVPGYRPGHRTAEFLERVIDRMTLIGASFLALLAVAPQLLMRFVNLGWSEASFFGGTSLLIVVGVALDLIQRMEMQLVTRHYRGFLGAAGRVRGRR